MLYQLEKMLHIKENWYILIYKWKNSNMNKFLFCIGGYLYRETEP